MFDKIYKKILENKEAKEQGKVNSISPPFPRLAERFPGFEKGKYWIITASSGIGKTKFTKFFTIASIYNFIKLNPSIKVKIFYFALEETIDEFWMSFVSAMLYEKYNIELSTAQLKSLGKFTLSEDHLDKIQECKSFINELSEFVVVRDHIHNPFGIYKEVRDYFELPENGTYIKNDLGHITGYNSSEDTHVFVITDHVGLLTAEKGLSQRESLGFFSQEYCLKGFCKRFNCTVVNIQQQAAESERLEFFKGETLEQKVEPSLTGLANNKEIQREADLILGLFAPARYKLSIHRGYDIEKLKDKYRSLIFLKDRNYGLNGAYIGLYFNGATNYFEELPPAEEFKKNPNLYNTYI